MISINFGQRIERRIDPAYESEIYTFDANAGDRVRILMSEIVGSFPIFSPAISLYNPDGTLAESTWNRSNAWISIELTQDGTYTIVTAENEADDTGDYSLNLQRTNNPGNATPINFGDIIEDGIDLDGEWDTYIFEANAGDRVRILMSEIVGSFPIFSPAISLYNPDGTLAESTWNRSNARISIELTQDGTYTMIAEDNEADDTGDYAINLQRFNNLKIDSLLGNDNIHLLNEETSNYGLHGIGDNDNLLGAYRNNHLIGVDKPDLIYSETGNILANFPNFVEEGVAFEVEI